MPEKHSPDRILEFVNSTLDALGNTDNPVNEYRYRDGSVNIGRSIKSGTFVVSVVEQGKVLTFEGDLCEPIQYSQGYIFDTTNQEIFIVRVVEIEDFAEYILNCLSVS